MPRRSARKALKLQGSAPSEADIDAGKYPLVRPFLFVVPLHPQAAASDFIAWIWQGRPNADWGSEEAA